MLFDCTCSCGNAVVKDKKYLTTNNEPSCGCARPYRSGVGAFNISGMTFGRLKAIRPTGEKYSNGSIIWEYLCECGNTYYAPAGRAFNGRLKSCGCLSAEIASKTHLLSPERAATVAMLNQMRNKNSKLGVRFDISEELVERLIQQPCIYCGVEFSKEYVRHSKVFNSEKVYLNGIDRVDSSLGYLDENIVPCCKICNSAKSNKTLGEFVEYVRGVKLDPLEQVAFSETQRTTYYHMYRRSAKLRNLEFYDDREFIKSFMIKPCYYCGGISNKPSGIDRVDTERGYTPDNSVPCCTTCNLAKLNYKSSDFAEWRVRVYNYMLEVGAFQDPQKLLNCRGALSEGKVVTQSKATRYTRSVQEIPRLAKVPVKVRCVETGQVFSSAGAAGRICGIQAANISRSCKTGIRAGVFHWVFVEEPS